MSSGFSSNTSIKKLTIGKHLDHFNGRLFYHCENLTWLYIEDSDKPLIFSNEFNYCPLSETYIGRNFDSKFDYSPFESTAIENLTLGANVTTLEKNAFKGCSQLSSVNLGNIQNIGAFAFSNCKKLSTPNFPTSIKSIDPFCFQDCDSIKEINLDCNVETIHKYAFAGCKSLKSVKITGLVRTIEGYAFYFCNKLSSIVIGEGIESIGENAFSSAAIDYIALPNSLKIIEKKAFFECKNLKKIIFGTNIEKIGKDAFNSYGNSIDVDTIVIRAAVPPSIEETTFSAKTYLNCVVIVPVESESAYKNTDGWKTFWNIEGRDFQSGIDNVIYDDSSISVITEESSIRILHNNDGNIVRVFSIQGTMIVETSENVINNLPKGLYIVTVGTKTFKVSLR